MGENGAVMSTKPSRLAELKERKVARDRAREQELEALETEALELEEKQVDQGKRPDVDFAVVTTLVGNFVVRKPDFVVAKRFSDVDNKTIEDVIALVHPCIVHPDTMVARAVFQEHGGVAWKLAGAVMKLYEADAGKKAGK